MIEWTRSAGCTSPVSLAYGCETDKGVVQYCFKDEDEDEADGL